MEPNEIPDQVLEFIARRIDSVPHLETLLLLWDSSDLTWNEQDVAARVYVNREHARNILLDLSKHGLIALADSLSEHYRYDAKWDVADLMAQIAASYRRHLTYVAGLIHAKASSEAVRQFASAFEFKRKE